jgi:hypothetical protein
LAKLLLYAKNEEIIERGRWSETWREVEWQRHKEMMEGVWMKWGG